MQQITCNEISKELIYTAWTNNKIFTIKTKYFTEMRYRISIQ